MRLRLRKTLYSTIWAVEKFMPVTSPNQNGGRPSPPRVSSRRANKSCAASAPRMLGVIASHCSASDFTMMLPLAGGVAYLALASGTFPAGTVTNQLNSRIAQCSRERSLRICL